MINRIARLLPLAALLVVVRAVAHQPAADGQSLESTYPVVITPTRLRQAIPDVPASVTVITADALRKFGITTVVDALRLVPGMQITQAGGHDLRINYHGTNALTPHRMNVLIDGISAYRPSYARVFWKQLPVAIEDIDRIEITRGPNSVTYGPNSMLAVINIITKHPKDVGPVMASAALGSQSTASATARLGVTADRTAIRVSVNSERDGGFDYLSRSKPQGHDATRMNRLNLRSQTEVSATTTLDFYGAYVEGVAEVPFADVYQASFPDAKTRDYYLGGVWTSQLSPMHEVQLRVNYANFSIRQPWVTCLPSALLLPELFALWQVSPAYANTILAGRIPSGGSAAADALAAAAIEAIGGLGQRARQPTCVTANQDLFESRFDLELQDTYVFSERLRVVAGAGARVQRGESQTIFAGPVSTTIYRAFINAEYKPRTWLHFNVGGYAEHDGLTGSTFSPRIALNARLSDHQTVRVVLSKGRRTPDLYEQRANWSYTFSDLTPALDGSTSGRFYQSARAPGNLHDERIFSKEVGYLLSVPRLGLTFDAKVFDDELTELISEKLQVASFQPTNNGAVRLSGAELQTNVELSPSWSAFFNYAYLRNHQATTQLERTQYARHSGAIGLAHIFGAGWRGSLAYYGSSGDGVGETHYGRTDLTLGKAFSVQRTRWEASVIASRLDNKSVTYFRDFGSTLENSYNNRVQVFGRLKISF